MRRLSLFLFYLLLIFIPTQLGRHFFFSFTTIAGLPSDYLTPTIYFTDIIVVLLIGSQLWSKSKKEKFATKKTLVLWLFIIGYLLFNTLFIAVNKLAAFYKFIKITEFILLGMAISRLKPKLGAIVFALSVGTFYSSILAIWQFAIQRSIGGIFWFLGERTFSAGTPGIAALSYKGSLLLRPYATFPHPNVLGGFLAVTLVFIFFYLINNWLRTNKLLKIWFILSLFFGLATLVLSFSRVAWLAALFGLTMVILEKKLHLSRKLMVWKNISLFIFYSLIILSVVIPLSLPTTLLSKYQYWQERVSLLKTTISAVAVNLPFGVGLNNSIIQQQKYINSFSGLYIFQPVHNIYLLILSETGLLGFFFFVLIISIIASKAFSSRSVFLYFFLQLLLLGLFDHYLFTLQQGQLLFVIFAALTFVPEMAY